MIATQLDLLAPPHLTRQPTHYWRVRTRLPHRFGQGCWVTARGTLNSCRVVFADGYWCITSRWNVRKIAMRREEVS